MLGEVKILLSSKQVTCVVQFSKEGEISSLRYLPLSDALLSVSKAMPGEKIHLRLVVP